jgi:hypothetical protein
VVVDIHQVGSSCGYSVPLYEFREHRQVLNKLWEKREKDVTEKGSEETMPRYALLSSCVPLSVCEAF